MAGRVPRDTHNVGKALPQPQSPADGCPRRRAAGRASEPEVFEEVLAAAATAGRSPTEDLIEASTTWSSPPR